MEKRFREVANEYINTGGGCMVDITTVWDKQRKGLLYVNINEDCLTVSTEDFIREELPETVDYDDVLLVSIDQAYFTTEPSFDNHDMNNIDDELAALMLDCLGNYIKNKVKHYKRNYFTTVDKLPNGLREQLTDDFIKWLNDRNQLVETDGYKIIFDNLYVVATIEDADTVKEAKSLRMHLDNVMPIADCGDDPKSWDKFYQEKLQVIYCGSLFEFQNCAAVYNALNELAKYIIDND